MAQELEVRAARHAALGDRHRLAVVDALARSDLTSAELRARLGLASNLLAHHLDVLEAAGLISRHRSNGDGRRRYVTLDRAALPSAGRAGGTTPQPALFVCSLNSARSQLAAALWTSLACEPALSAGTHAAEWVHPGAVAAARRAGLDLRAARPQPLAAVDDRPRLVITVCDRAHEELNEPGWLHWSIPDPVADGRPRAFDATVVELRRRISGLLREAS